MPTINQMIDKRVNYIKKVGKYFWDHRKELVARQAEAGWVGDRYPLKNDFHSEPTDFIPMSLYRHMCPDIVDYLNAMLWEAVREGKLTQQMLVKCMLRSA